MDISKLSKTVAGYPLYSSNRFAQDLAQIYEFGITYLPKSKNSVAKLTTSAKPTKNSKPRCISLEVKPRTQILHQDKLGRFCSTAKQVKKGRIGELVHPMGYNRRKANRIKMVG